MLPRFFLFLLTASVLAPLAEADEQAVVKVALLNEIAVYPERTAPANVISLNDATISAEIAASVTEIPVRVGDIVEPGSRLAMLECTDYKLAERRSIAMLESLNARIDLAAKRLERARLLEQQQSVSVEALDERSSELAVLQADKRIAAANQDGAARNVSRCEVTSPFRGVVVERLSAVGQFAGTGTPLLRVLDLSALEVSAQVSTDEITQIESADQIYFSYADRRFPVKTRSILPTINPATRNQEVRLLFSEDNAITGAAGKLIWSDPRPHIAADLLVQREGRLGIFIYADGLARFYPLVTAQAGRSTPVDLPGSAQIIIEGHYSLQDNTGVKVRN